MGITILDSNPAIAAKYLTKKDIIDHLKYLIRCFKDLREDTATDVDVLTTICCMKKNRQTYNWFVTFYKELQKLYKNYISEEKEYLSYLSFEDSYLTYLDYLPSGSVWFPRPTELLEKRKHLTKYTYSHKNLIMYNRCEYKKYRYSTYDFTCGKPRWYRIKTLIILDTYSKEDSTRFKVLLDSENNFRYFYSVLGTEYIEVKKVPVEIGYLIRGIVDL